MKRLKITCIIPSSCSGHTLSYLRRALFSLHQSARRQVKLNIIIVSQNSLPKDLKFQSYIKYFSAAEGDGFVQMNNLALVKSLRAELPDFYLFINDDAWVAADFFKQLRDIVKTTVADILAPKIYMAGHPTVIDAFGIEYFTSGYAKNANSDAVETTLAPAACMLVKGSFVKKMLVRYGFVFNPLLFYYLDDVEFSIRALGIGGNIHKTSRLVAYHVGSATSGKKSFFIMYQTYRNILWVILMTWPLRTIVRFLPNIFLVQGWVFFYSLKIFGSRLYLKVLLTTFFRLPMLISERRRILAVYSKSFRFESILSPYAFRTYHNLTIKI